MKDRYKTFVFENKEGKPCYVETGEGVTLEVSQGTDGEIIIKALNIITSSVYSKNYANPPIPVGYKYVEGEWNCGFVIERVSDGSQVVWIPVGFLDDDGTLDGVWFTEKFGRRNYLKDIFSRQEYHEPFVGDLAYQYESVKKYGGFYISRYMISKNKKTGRPQSVKGTMPWVKVNAIKAMDIAASFERSGKITSHLPYGAEFDSVLAWGIKSGAKTRNEIVDNSTSWGNYYDSENSQRAVIETGSDEEGCLNGIYGLAGNVMELTQEQNGAGYCVVRSGFYYNSGKICPVASRFYTNPHDAYAHTGFRVTLLLK